MSVCFKIRSPNEIVIEKEKKRLLVNCNVSLMKDNVCNVMTIFNKIFQVLVGPGKLAKLIFLIERQPSFRYVRPLSVIPRQRDKLMFVIAGQPLARYFRPWSVIRWR